jgi:putative inorganic carbon (HCO3(-)) transporter
MPIRDIVVTLIVLGALPLALMRPYIGVLVWTWISFMNPHRLTWGFAYDMPFALIIAVPTLLGLLITKERRPIPAVREAVLLAAFWAVTVLSTLFAQYPEWAWQDLKEFSKILLMTFVMILLMQDRLKLRFVLVIAAFSIGFYGLKGGLWALTTGGGAFGMVLGPDRSFIGDNNGLGLALNMTLPILFFLAREESNVWLRRLFYTVFCFSIVGVLLTYSRSGFLGLVAVLFVLVARSKWKVYAIAVALIGAVSLGAFLSERWFSRMESISEYEKDDSAMSRLYAWGIAWQIAVRSPLVGGGFRVVPQKESWEKYAPDYYHRTGLAHNTHSIYFHALAEHGFTGLFVLLVLIFSIWLSLRRIRREARSLHGGDWLINYSLMVETSLVAFLVTGAFQNLLYFDLFYFLIAVTVILKQLAKDSIVVAVPFASAELLTPEMQRVGRPGYVLRS